MSEQKLLMLIVDVRRFVSVRNNKLTGEIPSFNRCKNLQHLVLCQNHLSGKIPSFSGCKDLQYLNLRFNSLPMAQAWAYGKTKPEYPKRCKVVVSAAYKERKAYGV